MIVKLEESIKHGTDEISELEINRPNLSLIRKLGLPVKITSEGVDGFDIDVCAKYLEAITALPPSVINQLTFSDFMACTNVLLSFFESGASVQKAHLKQQ